MPGTELFRLHIHLRARDVTPDKLGDAVVDVLEQHAESIHLGALVVLETSRVRLLPLRR